MEAKLFGKGLGMKPLDISQSSFLPGCHAYHVPFLQVPSQHFRHRQRPSKLNESENGKGHSGPKL